MSDDDEQLTGGEYMTTAQIAGFLGYRPSSVSGWCHKWGVKRELLARTEDVIDAKSRMPGKTGRPKKER